MIGDSAANGWRQHASSETRAALLRQWERIAAAVPNLDHSRPSRATGWSNREVLAHLSIQPRLMGRFLRTASTDSPTISLVANLTGTASLAETIDQLARAATDADLDFAANVDRVTAELLAADLTMTVTSVQGPIRLADYLTTRCIEAVVHGRDFSPAIDADTVAMEIACSALRQVLVDRHPERISELEGIDADDWLDIATGRRLAPAGLADVCPVMR